MAIQEEIHQILDSSVETGIKVTSVEVKEEYGMLAATASYLNGPAAIRPSTTMVVYGKDAEGLADQLIPRIAPAINDHSTHRGRWGGGMD